MVIVSNCEHVTICQMADGSEGAPVGRAPGRGRRGGRIEGRSRRARRPPVILRYDDEIEDEAPPA